MPSSCARSRRKSLDGKNVWSNTWFSRLIWSAVARFRLGFTCRGLLEEEDDDEDADEVEMGFVLIFVFELMRVCTWYTSGEERGDVSQDAMLGGDGW